MKLIVAIPLMLIMIVALRASFVLILLGMLPSVVAYYAGKDENKISVATITCCNFAGALPYILDLTQNGNTWIRLSVMLSEPMVWVIMYGMAALGYMLVRSCPLIYNYALIVVNTSLAFQLQQKQDTLVREWGEGIVRDLPTVANLPAKKDTS